MTKSSPPPNRETSRVGQGKNDASQADASDITRLLWHAPHASRATATSLRSLSLPAMGDRGMRGCAGSVKSGRPFWAGMHRHPRPRDSLVWTRQPNCPIWRTAEVFTSETVATNPQLTRDGCGFDHVQVHPERRSGKRTHLLHQGGQPGFIAPNVTAVGLPVVLLHLGLPDSTRPNFVTHPDARELRLSPGGNGRRAACP